MHRLIARGLMFGNLVRVDSPVWVERYNRALKALTGRTTEQTEFHIDISGFSPEIGDEFGDPAYLNQAGVNRQFILLTTRQRSAPLLNAKFSTSRAILRQFIDANERELFALTARDAVAGELINSVYRADTAAKLFDIRQIIIEADTTAGTVATADKLGTLIDRFKREEDAWYDDVLIGEMIGLAKQTGDLTRNPVRLQKMTFAQEDFWTALFGGLYLFRSVPHPAVLSAGDPAALGPLPLPVIPLADRNGVARFLKDNGLAEPIVEARGVDAAAILHQKMDFITAELAAVMGESLEAATRRDLRAMGRRHAQHLPPEWQGLAALTRWAESGGPWPRIDSEHPAYFYTLRAAPGPLAELVNMLLAELTPLDIRQLFICHKEAFYRAYASWPEAKKTYVAEFLAGEYMVDKAGTRAALFGHEAPMAEPAPAQGPWSAGRPAKTARGFDVVDAVGPWGAVRRR
ncbi:DUF6638 family protein [Pseudoroseicyclus sp. H15]